MSFNSITIAYFYRFINNYLFTSYFFVYSQHNYFIIFLVKG